MKKIFMWIGIIVSCIIGIIFLIGFLYGFIQGLIEYGLWLDLLLTIIFYMIVPFFVFFRRKQEYDNSFINKFLIWNSIIVAILFIILRSILGYNNPVGSFAPALLYYLINSILWKNKDKKLKNTYAIKSEDIKIQKSNIESINILEEKEENKIESNNISKNNDIYTNNNNDKIIYITIAILLIIFIVIAVAMIEN